MTSRKQLKTRVRARMAKTGERYATALAHLVGNGAVPLHLDHGWALRGGTDPDAAGLAALLAHDSVTGPDGPLSEVMLFGIGGGLGAGYILWEFQHDNSRIVTLGFHNQWQYLGRRVERTLQRLGVEARWRRTGGAAGAAKKLTAELDAGHPAMVWPDRYHIGYWRLPAFLDGHGGHPVVVYAEENGRAHLDDRNLTPLTVAREDLDQARARVGTYRNALLVIDHARPVPVDTVRAAVRAGLRDVTEHLSAPSDSFSLPAWRKWSRMLIDTNAAKAWPRVFADRVDLTGALLSVWEGVEPAGMTGGNLRPLFAEFLTQAAALLDAPDLAEQAATWRRAAELWHALGESALPADNPVTARLRELTATMSSAVSHGDDGAAERAETAEQLWRLRHEHTKTPPFDDAAITDLLAAMSGILSEIHETEAKAITELRTARY